MSAAQELIELPKGQRGQVAAQDREERSGRVIVEDLLDFGIKLLGQRHAADSDHC